MAERERRARIRQVLDHVEQNDQVDRPNPLQVDVVRAALQDIESAAASVPDGFTGQFDTGNVEISRRFHQKEAIGASQLQ